MNNRQQALMDIIGRPEYKPLKLKEFRMLLEVPEQESESLKNDLNELVNQGKLIRTQRQKYMVNDDTNYAVGKYIAHPKGFGFVDLAEQEDDVFIGKDDTGQAIDGDTVSVRITAQKSEDKRMEGKILQVLERGISELIGTYETGDDFGFVIPDNRRILRDIYIAKQHNLHAVNGHKVVVEILNWGDRDKKPEGKITRIIGHVDDTETEIQSIIMAYGLPNVFQPPLLEEVARIPAQVSVEEIAAQTQREDWRSHLTVTIDGEDAKDLDDAITLVKKGEHYELGVHIADVSHYVRQDSLLDQEALRRGTSTYLIDRVIPMLPKELSNGICSLNAGQDRFCLSCIMEVDGSGQVVSHRIVETVINVDQRLNYSEVARVLEENDNQLMIQYHHLLDLFYDMKRVQQILHAKRVQRGSIDFNFEESKFKLDAEGRILEVMPYHRNIATKIIEEFMLLANETVAEDFYWQEIPFLYRNHDEPDNEKIKYLANFIYNFGYSIQGRLENLHPKEFQRLISSIQGTDEESVVSRLILRSMKQAKYEEYCNGHFGLAANYYCHFTSPIRRYPDLQIHRIIKQAINGQLSDEKTKHYADILPHVGRETSRLERRAVEVEREVTKYRKCEYMEDKIGQIYDGVISGLTNWGMFVELDNTVEGLVPMTWLDDDYYQYNADQMILVGEHSQKIYRLGQKLKVQLMKVDKRQKTIDFKLVQDEAEQSKPSLERPVKPKRKKKADSQKADSQKANSQKADSKQRKGESDKADRRKSAAKKSKKTKSADGKTKTGKSGYFSKTKAKSQKTKKHRSAKKH